MTYICEVFDPLFSFGSGIVDHGCHHSCGWHGCYALHALPWFPIPITKSPSKVHFTKICITSHSHRICESGANTNHSLMVRGSDDTSSRVNGGCPCTKLVNGVTVRKQQQSRTRSHTKSQSRIRLRRRMQSSTWVHQQWGTPKGQPTARSSSSLDFYKILGKVLA